MTMDVELWIEIVCSAFLQSCDTVYFDRVIGKILDLQSGQFGYAGKGMDISLMTNRALSPRLKALLKHR